MAAANIMAICCCIALLSNSLANGRFIQWFIWAGFAWLNAHFLIEALNK